MITKVDGDGAQAPTRERILAAAVELFGRRGYAATSVGEIERAAGLTPRAGGFYKHFPSKRAVLEAVVAKRAKAAADAGATVDTESAGDIRAEAEVVGRWSLKIVLADQPLLRIVMREGDNFPELRDEFYARIVSRGQLSFVTWLRRAAERTGTPIDHLDVEALAGLLLGSIVNHCVLTTLFGQAAGGVSDDRFLAAWTDSTLRLLEAHGLLVPNQPDREASA